MANEIVHNEPPDLSNPNPPPAPPLSPEGKAAPKTDEAKKPGLIAPMDLWHALENDPPPRDFVLPGFRLGTVGALVSPGATGKSWWTLEAAIGIACTVAGGADLLGLEPPKRGPVIYLSAEDPEEETWHRVRAMRKHLTHEQAWDISTNLYVLPLVGKRMDIMEDEWLDAISNFAIGVIHPRLIILDTLSRCHTLDENSNGDMARVMANLEKLATDTGASVLFLHHIGKGSARAKEGSDQTAARGASALIDNARWGAFVERMSPDEGERWGDPAYSGKPIGRENADRYMRFGVSKVNYSARPEDRWYKRHEGGVLLPVELVEVSKGKGNKGGRDRDEAPY